MHELLSLEQRVRRARRRLGEIAVWRVREAAVIGAWSFDGVTIATGDPWPNDRGVHSFKGGPFEVPADGRWRRRASRSTSAARACSPSTTTAPRRSRWASTSTTTSSRSMAPAAVCTIEAVAAARSARPTDPRLRRAELRRIETELIDLHRTRRAWPSVWPPRLASTSYRRCCWSWSRTPWRALRMPTRTEDVVGRESPFAQGYGGRDDGTAPLPGRRRWTTTHARRSCRPAPGSSRTEGAARALSAARRGGLCRPRPYRHRLAVADRGDSPQGAPHLLDRRRPAASAIPDFRFAQSFAEYYRYLEDDDPALLELVRAQVATAAGRRPAASGSSRTSTCRAAKSLVRQALYGQLYFERTFGAAAHQRLAAGHLRLFRRPCRRS